MGEWPAFAARAPWWGPDLQTVCNLLRRPRPRASVASRERLALPLADGSGDLLSALLERPPRAERVPVMLVHGLGGCEDSHYMGVSAAALLRRGHPVVRLNLRGAGPSGATCRGLYHAGRSADVRDAIRGLPEDLLARGLVLVGFSLGGNVLLKLLGEGLAGLPVLAAASVSAPIDLAACSRRMCAPRNRVYQAYLVRRLKREASEGAAQLSSAERVALRTARSVYEFDDGFVAPRNGWSGAPEYYARNAALSFLPEIRTPTLLVHALDDPWIPAEAYLRFAWRENPSLLPALASGGGHVGFHARGSRLPWHDRCLARFLEGRGL